MRVVRIASTGCNKHAVPKAGPGCRSNHRRQKAGRTPGTTVGVRTISVRIPASACTVALCALHELQSKLARRALYRLGRRGAACSSNNQGAVPVFRESKIESRDDGTDRESAMALPSTTWLTAHPPVSDSLRVSHHDLPSSPRGESPLRSELLAKAFAENGPERIPRSAWGAQACMRLGIDLPTPPGRSSTSHRRLSSAPGCLSSSEDSSASASPVLTPATAAPSPPASPPLTPAAAYGLGVLEALVSAGASHPARVSGSRRKGASVWHVTTVHGV